MSARSRSGSAAESSAARAATRASRTKDGLTLSNGIVLRLKPVAPFAVRQAALGIPDPKVPRVFIEDKGREELNPNDPDYLAAVDDVRVERISAVTTLMFMAGTEVISVPDGTSGPEDDDWIDMLEAAGLTIDRTNKYKRYYQWLAWYAASEVDISLIVAGVSAISGVREEDVQKAIAGFRD